MVEYKCGDAATKTMLHKRNDTMNQHIPTQRPPQRSPQRQPQRQPQKPPSHKYSTAFIAILVSTVALLVISLIALCVALAVGGFGDDLPVADNPKGGNDPQVTTQPTTPSAPTVKAKFLTLPSATVVGSYASTSGTNADVSSDVNIKSAAAVLVDVSSGKSIAQKEADTRIYPASMTKVMTLLIACENAKNPTDKMTITQEMIDYQSNAGASGIMGFKAGESITVEDALFLINYNSDTIACLLIANHIAGSEDAFVQMMNRRAQELGCTGTNFVNTTGLEDENHYTTCRDMATIMTAAMNNSAAKTVLTSYKAYTVSVYVEKNSTPTISRSPSIYAGWYSTRLKDNNSLGGGMKIIAGKTGSEDTPTACFVTVAKDDSTGKTYVCVTVGRIRKGEGTGVSTTVSTSDTKHLYQTYAAGQ